jgi:hypothetical protein
MATATLGLKNDYADGDALDDADLNAAADAIEVAFAGMLLKDCSGSADITLTSTEARNPLLYLNGTLTGDIDVILPTWAKRWLIINASSGAFSITVKTASGAGVAITQGYQGEVYGDGTDILRRGSESTGSTVRVSTVILAGLTSSPVATVQNVATGNTITLPTGGKNKRLSASAGAATGVILTAGTVDGQELTLFNIEATNTITMAAAGTSNVADGASCVIGALRAIHLTWDSVSARWYRTG